jgi:hypothetical protein
MADSLQVKVASTNTSNAGEVYGVVVLIVDAAEPGISCRDGIQQESVGLPE